VVDVADLLEPLIDDESRAFLESPCSLIVGTVDDDGLPEATRGWGVEVAAGGREVRLLLAENAAVTLANLATNGRIALTATHFVSLDSVQLKGHAVAVGPRTSADRIRFDAYCAGCVQVISEIDRVPAELVRRIVVADVVACVFAVEEVYDQTPGPAAGARLAPTPAVP
jgi:predicted pyridoxine 5'-phosphate oxidase superfamily flavin-nucleotide-binding protein